MDRLHIEIPDLDPPGLEAFLRAHPEKRDQIEALRREDHETRQFAARVIADIYDHYVSGAPSHGGLRATLRSFLRLLDEDARQTRQRQAPHLQDVHEAAARLRAWIGEQPDYHDPRGDARRLLDRIDDLFDEVDDIRAHLRSEARISRYENTRVRAETLAQAAELVRAGATAEELEQRSASSRPMMGAFDETATRYGIELSSKEDEGTS